MANYLSVNILTTVGFPDCTNRGISSQAGVKLAVPCREGNLTEDDIVNGNYTVMDAHWHNGCINSFKQRGDDRWLMNGGNWVYSSDSRYRVTYGGPIAIHDRYEA